MTIRPMLMEGHSVPHLTIPGLFLILFGIGCTSPRPDDGNVLRLDLDRTDPRSFIQYYFGGLASAEGSDPFEAGIVVDSSGHFYLNVAALSSQIGPSSIRDGNNDGTLDWDELAPFLEETYYAARRIPASLDSLGAFPDGGRWFELSVDGVMTTATRHIRVPVDALRHALENYESAGEKLIYPAGTVITSDHTIGDRIVERSVMKKRSDGFWDFAVFDSAGVRAPATATPPKSLTVPTQCVGCHLGSRLYDPEKSFPAPARPGPSGPRKVHWENPLPPPDLVRHFDEHRKRSDGILGLYGTLYVSDLESRRADGAISNDDQQLLESLGL